MSIKPTISVVVPLLNEEENLRELTKRLDETLGNCADGHEILFVDDGSTDSSPEIIESLYAENDRVGYLRLFRNSGKAMALEQGFQHVTGELVAIIDADLQHDPEDIGVLVDKIGEGFDVVSGRRAARQDAKGKILTSEIFNIFIRIMVGLDFKDFFSGLKVFRTRVIHFLSLFGDLYRFAAVFAARAGWRVTEVPVNHHHRAHGESKYSKIGRIQRAVADIIVVLLSITLSRRRSYLSGMAGSLLLALSATLFAVIYVFGEVSGWGSGILVIAAVVGWLGALGILTRTIGDSFYRRHLEERDLRKRNVMCVRLPRCPALRSE